LDAQYVNAEAGMPADSTSAAYCNDRDFGTSRFRRSFGQNTPLLVVEEGQKADANGILESAIA
jgi:hypothetical protein